jgi:hypothetical protein
MNDDTNRCSSWWLQLARRVKATRSRRCSRHGQFECTSENGSKTRDALTSTTTESDNDLNEMGERQDYQAGILGDVVTRPVDFTDMLHGLAATNFDVQAVNSHEHVGENDSAIVALRCRLMAQLISLPDQVWCLIASYLDLADRASLAMACNLTFAKLSRDAFSAFRPLESKQEKLKFLSRLDMSLPFHLLCFHCGIYHKRVQAGNETLKANFVTHPVFICPLVRTTVLPRTRLAHGRELPYVFVQLAVRAARFGPHYGISVGSLERRWRDPESDWTHQTRYYVHKGHLLLRVRSQVWARSGLTPSEMRQLLFERYEYTPYFSVCKHWRDGELTPVCKCVLSHVPGPPPRAIQKIKSASSTALRPPPMHSATSSTRQCSFCAPARRCPECPSEYVVKLIRAEDKYDSVERFKFMLIVIRWCDLGDGSGPLSSTEWASINGLVAGYPSLEKIKNRALMGTFESAVTGVPPRNRLLSLNPKNIKKGEAGTDWY